MRRIRDIPSYGIRRDTRKMRRTGERLTVYRLMLCVNLALMNDQLSRPISAGLPVSLLSLSFASTFTRHRDRIAEKWSFEETATADEQMSSRCKGSSTNSNMTSWIMRLRHGSSAVSSPL